MQKNDFYTIYGRNQFDRLSPAFEVEATAHPDITAEQAGSLVERLAYDLQQAGGTLDANYVLELAGKVRKLPEIIEIITSHSHRLSLRAIRGFERDFLKLQEPSDIISQVQSGNRDAQQLIRRLAMFPTEGINVWAEYNFPEFASNQAGRLQDRVSVYYQEHIEDDVFVWAHGPLIPVANQDRILRMLRDEFPGMRYDIRNLINAPTDAAPKHFLN